MPALSTVKGPSAQTCGRSFDGDATFSLKCDASLALPDVGIVRVSFKKALFQSNRAVMKAFFM